MQCSKVMRLGIILPISGKFSCSSQFVKKAKTTLRCPEGSR